MFFFQLFLLTAIPVFSQSPRTFSSDPVLFVAEIETFFNQVPERERETAQAVVSNLRQAFNKGLFKSNQQVAIINVSNRMLELDLRPQPYFFSFFSASLAYQAKSGNEESFLSWCSGIHLLLSRKRSRQLQSFLEFSHQFFRAGILFQSQVVQWNVSNAEWQFVADTLPALRIRSANLQCIADRDTLLITNASGIYNPISELWNGFDGRVSWDFFENEPRKVSVRLLKYNISLRFSAYSADSATLAYPAFFRQPLPGSFSDRTTQGSTDQFRSYPRFKAFNNNLYIPNILPRIDYNGGFAIEGNRIIGCGTENKDAVCTIKRKNLPLLSLSSRNFVFRQDRLSSQRAALNLVYEGDSIYHPGLQVKYQTTSNLLALLRGEEGTAQSPFFSTVHNMDMFLDAFYWNLDQNFIELGSIKGLQKESEAAFESINSFKPEKFFKLQGIDRMHPAVVVSGFMRNRTSTSFFHEELAAYMKIDLAQVSAMLINMANHGLVMYNSENGKVIVKNRLRQLVDVINNRSDYDVISIHSKVDGLVNATLNLDNFDLTVRGIKELILSDAQKVNIIPAKEEIVLKRNRDFTFSGKVSAGFFEFYASKCSFQYDKFKLNLAQIDSLAFNVPVEAKDQAQKDGLERVKTVLSNISGELLIGHPNNKSGRFAQDDYPKFTSTTESYVYFDQPYIQKGVYKKENFYYHVLPFTIDSLNSFSTVGIRFNGYLFSGGLLPEISEPLKVQPDFSLGLTCQLPSAGTPIYNGRGKAFVLLSLSQNGLRGQGKIEYLSSESWSKDFLFHPDSMMAMVDEFMLTESAGSPSWPSVGAKNIKQRWLVNQEKMVLASTSNEPFTMYQKQVAHRGSLILNHEGLFGSGNLTFDLSEATSKLFRFQHQNISAESASFRIKSSTGATLVSNNNLSFALDTGLRQGLFSSGMSKTYTEFPVNQYRCNLPLLRWEVDMKELYISSETTLDSQENKSYEFISTHPQQESLKFNASQAYLDMRDNLLTIEGVPLILVADAEVIPIDHKVVVQPNAVMNEIKGASITANTITRYHQLYNGNIKIAGRRKYTGNGVYDFTDETGKMQTIYFNEIGVDSEGATYGLANIKDSDFSLSRHFDFRGTIRFSSKKNTFYYDGGYRIKHECNDMPLPWVQFKGEITSENTKLPVIENPKDISGANLTSSIAFSLASSKPYGRFLDRKEAQGDHEMLKVAGEIRFDVLRNRYIIEGDTTDQTPGKGTVLNFDITRCHIFGRGNVNIGQDFGQVKMKTAGEIEYFMINDSTVMQIFAALDFFFAENAIQLMANKLNSFNLPGLNLGGEVFKLGLNLAAGRELSRQLISELNQFGTFRRFPQELSNSLVLSNLILKWNKTTRSFTSVGPIGVVAVNKQLVSKSVPGNIEIVRRRTGDVLNLYLEPDRNEWYFFSYSNGILQAISSNNEFNNLLVNLKESQRKLKTNPNEEPYQFIISTQQTRNAFLRRMRP